MKKWLSYFWRCYLVLVVVITLVAFAADRTIGFAGAVVAGILLATPFGALVAILPAARSGKTESFKDQLAANRANVDQRLVEFKSEQEERKALAAEKAEEQKHIVKTAILHESSRKSFASSAARGAVGGYFFGLNGMLAGNASGKTKDSTVFLVDYSDGTRRTVKTKTGGMMYLHYTQFLEV